MKNEKLLKSFSVELGKIQDSSLVQIVRELIFNNCQKNEIIKTIRYYWPETI